QFYIGSSHYALKDYKSAIAQQQTMVKNYPNNVRAPDALLVIAGSQVELNDRRGARATLERIIREYPGVPAAQTAKERLELLK
ncbi:tetratricopeptide repeat protein, partial [Pigmentiphaga sp.]